MELHDGSFMTITELRVSKDDSSVSFDGHLFRRVEDFEKYLPVKFGGNELVWLCEAKEQDPKPKCYLRSASSKDVLRIRHLVFATPESGSKSFPQLRGTGELTDGMPPLTCQWQLVAELSKSHSRGALRSFRSAVRGSQPKAFIALSSQRPLGGGMAAADFFHSQHHLDNGRLKVGKKSKKGTKSKIYTFADTFCGAGGVSSGARDAGLRIEWAFDEDGDAIDTYALNHGKDSCKQMSAETFLKPENTYGTAKVDILHLSPPCQGFTLACRGSPKNGEKDNECMTYVGGIVKKVKPRIVTFEEVREILIRHREYFTSMVRDLTSIGYSVRWRVLECADFGVAQKRRRLFMIASR